MVSSNISEIFTRVKQNAGVATKAPTTSIPKFLFHGTDAKIVKLSPKERVSFLHSCREFIDIAVPICVSIPKDCPNGMEPKAFLAIPDAIRNARERHRGNGQFQYGDFYLTRYAADAFDYAMRAWAGGELARDAYSLAKIVNHLHLDGCIPDGNTKNFMERIISFAELPATPIAFYIPTEQLNQEKLKEFRGGPVHWENDVLFRYLGGVPQLNLSKAAFLPCDCNPRNLAAEVIFENVEPAF